MRDVLEREAESLSKLARAARLARNLHLCTAGGCTQPVVLCIRAAIPSFSA